MPTTKTNAMTVADIMTPDAITAGPGDTLAAVARLLDANDISGVPVIDVHEHVIGVVSKTDVLHRAVAGPSGTRYGSFLETIEGFGGSTDVDPGEFGVAEEFMSTEFLTVAQDEPVSKLARRMAKDGFHRAIVVDEEDRLIGIVTSLDILRVFP